MGTTKLRIQYAALGTVLALLLAWTPVAGAQPRAFTSPEEAMNAFGDAVARSDEAAVKTLLGPDYRNYIPPVGAEIRYRFLEAWARAHSIKPAGDDQALIAVGTDGWTLPIPLVKSARGWRFDMRAGAEEIRVRRIGRNELAVMRVMLAIHDAQMEYATVDRDGNGVLEYAVRFRSSPGKRNGLYWPAKPGEASSPLGPLVAEARDAGARPGSGYHGYRYRLLRAQGKNAPGGAFDYVARGRKIGGFAAVAWPVRYGDSGVMTFMVNHQGIVYEKNLGLDTATRASGMRRFDPDASWRKVDAKD